MVSEIFGGNRSTIAFVSVGLMGAGLLVNFIITIYWWSYYNPYGIRYQNTVFGTYFCSIVCWISSIVCILAIVFMLLSFFLFPRLAQNNLLSLILVTFTTIFGILSFISGFLCGCFGFYYKKSIYNFNKKDIYVKTKCYHYLLTTSHEGPFAYAHIQKKGESYANWLFKILKKIERTVKDEEKEEFVRTVINTVEKNQSNAFEIYMQNRFITSQNRYRDDLCSALGGPALIFSLMIFIGVLCFCFAAFCFGAGKSLVSNSQI